MSDGVCDPVKERLTAYHYDFEPTGYCAIDDVLAAVAAAGTAYHHTDGWNDYRDQEGRTHRDKIQLAADTAAAEIMALKIRIECYEGLMDSCQMRMAKEELNAAQLPRIVRPR